MLEFIKQLPRVLTFSLILFSSPSLVLNIVLISATQAITPEEEMLHHAMQIANSENTATELAGYCHSRFCKDGGAHWVHHQRAMPTDILFNYILISLIYCGSLLALRHLTAIRVQLLVCDNLSELERHFQSTITLRDFNSMDSCYLSDTQLNQDTT